MEHQFVYVVAYYAFQAQHRPENILVNVYESKKRAERWAHAIGNDFISLKIARVQSDT